MNRPPDHSRVHWPAVDVIVGNPPFLGGKKMRGELGDHYVDRLRDRTMMIRCQAVQTCLTYWFELRDNRLKIGQRLAALVS